MINDQNIENYSVLLVIKIIIIINSELPLYSLSDSKDGGRTITSVYPAFPDVNFSA